MKSIKERVDEIIADGKITKAENREFNEAVRQDGTIDKAEEEQIARLLELIDSGQIKVV